MDQKTWLWRKRSSEKTIVANGEEVQSVPNEKQVEMENSLKSLNEKLASVIDECAAKEKLVQDYEMKAQNYEKKTEDAMADKHKAEEEVECLKQELDEAHRQRESANERLVHLNSALKDCMEQLNLVRKEQEQRLCDAVTKAHKKLEERLASLTSENSYLGQALLVKEKLIQDLNSIKNQTEAEFEALMTRLDSIEKENAFLRYEFRALEKELELRNDEMEYSRRVAEASHKQHLENVKKIKKLEAECQRLRALTRKRLSGLPGPAYLPNIKSDIEVHERNQIICTRRKGMTGSSVPYNESKKLGFLTDQVQDLEKENQILRESLARKEEEIFYYQKFNDVSSHEKLALALSNPAPDEQSSVSGYGVGDSNTIASSRSWDPQGEAECKMIGASEMSLMDDFVEMEKLAIVAVDSLPNVSKETKELVPVGPDEPNDQSCKKSNDWIQNVRAIILEQQKISKRSPDELLGDIRMALESTIHPEPSKSLPISGYITWKSPTSSPSSSLIPESTNEFQPSDLTRSISKIIELVGQFDLNTQDDCKIHVFRWKNRELTAMLKEFVRSCNYLLGGEMNYEKFSGDLASVLGWIIDNCIPYDDHSTIRDEFVKHLGGDGPGTALELESVQNLMLEMEKMYSVSQAEINGLENELDIIKSSDKEPQQNDASLLNELEILKESKRTTEDQMENLKVINEDLDTQLTVTKAKLNEVLQKLSSVEVELENKNHCCEELEGTCLELQLQLESITSTQRSGDNENQEGLLQTGMEITQASVRLAECEETILKLGKQLKALGSAKELSVVDKVISITDTKINKLRQRSSLRDQMLSEDNTQVKNHLEESPETKEIISATEANDSSNMNENKNPKSRALIIVPSKKRGGGFAFLKKLLLRRKKGSSISNNIYFGK